MNDLAATNSITIAAAIDEVWEALTTPDQIKRWFFGVDTETDWKVGSPLVHRGEYQGKPYEDKGEIVRFDPPELLVHTHWSDLSGTPERTVRSTIKRWRGRWPSATVRPSSRSRSATSPRKMRRPSRRKVGRRSSPT